MYGIWELIYFVILWAYLAMAILYGASLVVVAFVVVARKVMT